MNERDSGKAAEPPRGARPAKIGMTASSVSEPPPARQVPVVHGMSIDVEDHRHILSSRFRGHPGEVSAQFDRDMNEILAILDATGTKATFFVIGTIAEQRRDCLRRWADLGHEIASHGYAHKPIWAMTPTELREELQRCKKRLEDTISKPVTGYRAPIFSVRWDTVWALDTISECGFTYDSSIVPIRMRRYGVADFDPQPAPYLLPCGRRIVEIPVSIGRLLGLTMPVAGGGYFRLLPQRMIHRAVRRFGAAGNVFLIYCHPFEISRQSFRSADLAENWPDRLKAGLISLKSNLGRAKVGGLIRSILETFRFAPLNAIAEKQETHEPKRLLAKARSDIRRPV